MKVAVIVPPHALDVLWGMRCSYHLALGQELARDPQYREWYRSALTRGDFVIVDNGAAEPEEERIPFDQIVRYANAIMADEIVMPDVLYDSRETIRGVLKSTSMVPTHRRLVIPQGETVSEWCHCLDYLSKKLSFATVGIPKHLERHAHGRVRALDHILKRGYHQIYNVHLFGIYRDPIAEIRSALEVYPGIRGVDSGCMCAYAQNGRTITVSPPNHFSLDWDAPCDHRLLERNIDILRRYAEITKCTSF